MRKLIKCLPLYLFFCVYCLNGTKAIAQHLTVDSIAKAELQLKLYADSLLKGVVESNRQMALSSFNPLLMDLLSNPETFNYPFSAIENLSKLKSEDEIIRIYSWAYRSSVDGTYTYYGILQYKDPDDGRIKRLGLVEVKQPTEDVIHKELQPEEWYGSLYYQIIQKKVKKSVYYYLLGWHGNDRFTTRKVIDVITFDPWGKPVFGAPFFLNEKNETQHRVIFEFTAEAVMTLRYEKNKKMIVFDHLSPASPSAKGQYRFYGPDFTYDGYRFKKGIWKYQTNLDMRNQSK